MEKTRVREIMSGPAVVVTPDTRVPAVISLMKERGIRHQEIDVIADETAYDEMISLSGQELAPVIEVNGKILADFGPEQLADFWERVGDKDAYLAAR